MWRKHTARRKEEKGDDGSISGEEPEVPKGDSRECVFSVREEGKKATEGEKQRVKDHRSNVRRGDLLTSLKEPTMHGFFQQTETPQ